MEKDKNWRRVFKALQLIEVCLKHGNPSFCDAVRSDIWRVMKWGELHYNEGGKDVGSGVR